MQDDIDAMARAYAAEEEASASLADVSTTATALQNIANTAVARLVRLAPPSLETNCHLAAPFPPVAPNAADFRSRPTFRPSYIDAFVDALTTKTTRMFRGPWPSGPCPNTSQFRLQHPASTGGIPAASQPTALSMPSLASPFINPTSAAYSGFNLTNPSGSVAGDPRLPPPHPYQNYDAPMMSSRSFGDRPVGGGLENVDQQQQQQQQQQWQSWQQDNDTWQISSVTSMVEDVPGDCLFNVYTSTF